MQMKSEGHLLENSLLFGGDGLFVLARSSTDRTRPTHLMKGNLLIQNSPI